MREKIDTIPINDAFASGDECPFCYLERQAEQRAIKYTIGPGASYMEPEIRAITFLCQMTAFFLVYRKQKQQ